MLSHDEWSKCWEEGWNAFWNSKYMHECPYTPASAEAEAWYQGYANAERQECYEMPDNFPVHPDF